MTKASFYLASKSPRRRELLTQIGVNYALLDVQVAERQGAKECPRDYVTRLAREKAEAGVALVSSRDAVLGADTVVVCDNQVMEKPRDQAHAKQMLATLSGRTHQVMTGVCVSGGSRTESRLSVSEVSFRKIEEKEYQAYWATGEPEDKAGGYGIQGFGAVFVVKLVGSYSAVVGLPLAETAELLSLFGVPRWNSLER